MKIALSAIAEVRRNQELLARLSGELEPKQAQVTANFNADAESPQILWFIVTQGRLPTTEERRRQLARHNYNVTGEPSEEG